MSVGATRMELQTVLLVDLIGYPRLYLAGPHSNYEHALRVSRGNTTRISLEKDLGL